MAKTERWRNVITDPMELFPETWRCEPRPSLSDLEASVRQLVADSGMMTRNCTVYPATPCVFDNIQTVLDVLLPMVAARPTASEEEKECMLEEMSARLIEGCSHSATSGSFPLDIFILHAEKQPEED
ncbi:unnamed protein product [Ixodes hexagonus]